MESTTQNRAPLKDLSSEDIELDLEVGQKIIQLSEKLGVHDAEVFMVKAASTDFSIEKDVVKFASSGIEFGMGIRIIKDKRLGFGYCTSLAHAESAIKNALSTTKLSKPLDFNFINNKEFQVINIPSIFDAGLLELTIEDGLEYSQQLISASKEIDKRIIITGGGLGYGVGSVALITSNGNELTYKGTGISCGVSTILKDKTVSTGYEFIHSRINDVDYNKIGTVAAELAVKGQNPESIEPGNYDVIITPHAISELFEFTIIPALYGEQAMKGETFYSNRINEQVTSQGISLFDDGTLENGVNSSPIDDEGTPTQRTTLVENGILKSYLFDRITGLEFNEPTTGNAVRAEGYGGGKSYKTIPKTKALNFIISGKTKSRDELLAEIGDGLIIYELLGAHTANTASGDFSVNSPTLFKVKNGEIFKAGKQVMISGNMGQLMEHVIGLGDDFKNVSGGLTPVGFNIPSIAIEDVKII